MTITSFDALRDWFMANGKGDDMSPHWNLYGSQYGQTDTRVVSNTRLDDMNESFNYLQQTIRNLNNPDGARFRVMQFPKGKPNHPTANVYVQIFERQGSGGAPMASIGSLPEGYVAKTDLDKALAEARRQWELERKIDELEAAVNTPPEDWTEKFIAGVERIGATPIGAVLMAKILGGPLPPMPGINGTPGAAAGSHTDETDDEDQFFTDIEATAQTLGITDNELASKMRKLVETNPTMAQQILSTL